MSYTVIIRQPDDLDEFRCAARKLLAAGAVPADVVWAAEGTSSLFHADLLDAEKITAVPRAFVTLAASVICHRHEQRWPLLYQALWRIDRGETALLQQASDPLMHRLFKMAAAVRRDQHQMTAFVRFRMVPAADDEFFVAWYEPRHRILRRAASFFIDRFASMQFAILTPDLTLHWDRSAEQFGPGLPRNDRSEEDVVEDWWRRYYGAIFNPARTNARLMQRHMPKRFWRNLPEAKDIADLVGQAGFRTARMIQQSDLPSSA